MTRTFRVLTYNVRHEIDGDTDAWKPRRDALATLVRSLDPDVVALQEAAERQLSDLRPRLPGYTWFGCGESSFGENNPIGSNGSADVTETETTWLSATPETAGSTGWDGAFPRVLVEATIEIGGGSNDDGSHTVTVFNTHFDHRGRRARRESARLIRRRLDALPASRQAVVMGDFNAPADSAVDRILTGDGYDRALSDAWRTADTVRGPETTLTDFESLRPGRRLDRIFITAGLTARRVHARTDRADGAFPSDHLPVCATLEPTG